MRPIDADALMDTLQELFDRKEKNARFTGSRGETVSWDDAIYYIKVAPTIDVVPVVRCKNCKYAEVIDDRITCDYTTEWLNPNGYCNMGEKDDEK